MESIEYKESKESKWFFRLRVYERTHLSRKFPMNENESAEEWYIRVYNIVKKKTSGKEKESKKEKTIQ